MDLSRSSSGSHPALPDALLGAPATGTATLALPAPAPAGGLLRRRGSRVRNTPTRFQRRRLRRAARRADRLRARADRLAGLSPASVEFIPSPLLDDGVLARLPHPLTNDGAPASTTTAAFDDAAALLDLWDTPSDELTDTAEWTYEDAGAAVPDTIDLSDSPKLIQRPEPVAEQLVPSPRPMPAAEPATEAQQDAEPADTITAEPAEPADEPAQPVPGSRLAEPTMAAGLAAVASLAAWGTLAPSSIWFPLALLPAAGLAALVAPGRDAARVVRAAIVLGAAAVLPAVSTAMTPVTLLIALVAAATYPLFTRTAAARTITALAVVSLLTPLVVEALRAGPRAFMASLFDPVSGTQTAVRIALTSGVIAAGLIGASATATRRRMDQNEQPGEQEDGPELPGPDVLLGRLTWILDRHALDPRADSGYPAGLGLIELGLSEDGDAGTRIADEAGRRLRACLPDHELLARLAPNRFAVLLLEATAADCGDLARDLASCLEQPIDGRSVTANLGTAIHTTGDAAELLARAEQALAAAQRQGRSGWVMFDGAVHAYAQSQAGLELQLRDAIRSGAIGACYQPVLALGDLHADDDRIVGAEALPCWTAPDGTDVPASRFVPLADELGLGRQLGLHLVELALDALLDWHRDGVGVDQVWVNLSPSQLRDADLAHEISARLAVRGLSSSCLVLEVSATQLTETEQALSSLSMLRSLGVAIALDDFGRSGTSLTALRSLPISAVKVDQGLAGELGRQDAVPRSIARLCHSLGLRVVVQGIETMVQLHGARDIEADAVQGHAIARPMSAQDITNLLSLRLPREFRLR